jgi:chromosome segregation ATPase
MRKKKLSDLVREEVQHTEDSQAQPDDAQTDSSSNVQSSSTSRLPSGQRQSRSRRGQTATDRAEDKIKELISALESAQKRANFLESQLNSLDSELQKQKNLVETFKSQLQQKTEIETELKEQKQLVRKLYSELGKVDSVLTELEEQKQLVKQLTTELEETRSTLPLPGEQSPKPLPIKESLVKSVSLYSSPMTRFVAANQPPTILSNEDIGWFD